MCYLLPLAFEGALRAYIQNLFRGREPEIRVAGHSATIDLAARERESRQ